MVRRMGVPLSAFARSASALARSLTRSFVATIVVFVALGTCLAFGQTSTASILGVVRDASGALIPGVNITVKHTESNYTRTIISDERGAYKVPLLPVGAYEVITTMPGFKQEVRKGINLVIDQEAVV